MKILGQSRPGKSRDPGILQKSRPENPGIKIPENAGACCWPVGWVPLQCRPGKLLPWPLCFSSTVFLNFLKCISLQCNTVQCRTVKGSADTALTAAVFWDWQPGHGQPVKFFGKLGIFGLFGIMVMMTMMKMVKVTEL